MKSPESYRKEYPKSAKEKFAIPRNKDGEPNEEVFKITKHFAEKLSKYPSFIGVAPHGSKMKGYSDVESDTDLAIFTDEPSTDERFKPIDLRKEALEISYLFGGPDQIHIEYYNVNKGELQYAIRNSNNYPGRIALVNFLGLATGPKVLEYRKIFADEVNKLPDDKRTKFIRDIIEVALSLEASRTGEINERIPETDGAHLGTFRTDLWEKRISNILTTQYK
jgi:hypothetical protein